MKKAIILITLSLGITGCISPALTKPDDGYMLYGQACEHHNSLGLSWDSPVSDEICAYVRYGGTLSSDAMTVIQQEQTAFTLIAEAHRKANWQLPDNTTFSSGTEFPDLSTWRGINRVATVQAIQLHLDGKSQDALSFLVSYNATGMKIAKTGILIHALVHVSCRSKQYPVLTSSIDDLPDEALAKELARAKEQYAQIPSVSECIRGNQYMVINTAKGLFSDLRAQLKSNREKMVKGLKQAGVDQKVLKQIEAGERLSVSDWEAQLLSHLRRLQAFQTNALSTRPSSELRKIIDEIEKAIDQVGNGVAQEAAMAAWELYMNSGASGVFSMPDAERLHSQVGNAISHQFLSMIMPAVGGFGITYRKFIAFERLLLIQLAARLYASQHGRRPPTLQQLVDDRLLDADMIIDPLSRETFHTKKSKPFEAYSVGIDLDDDKGIPWNSYTRSGDTILIRLKEKWGARGKPRR